MRRPRPTGLFLIMKSSWIISLLIGLAFRVEGGATPSEEPAPAGLSASSDFAAPGLRGEGATGRGRRAGAVRSPRATGR